jgi:hypothetical protein
VRCYRCPPTSSCDGYYHLKLLAGLIGWSDPVRLTRDEEVRIGIGVSEPQPTGRWRSAHSLFPAAHLGEKERAELARAVRYIVDLGGNRMELTV